MRDLIEKVRKYPILYNTSHPDYAKKTLKDTIWLQIAEELNYDDGEDAKSAWLKLRNCHRDALRRKEIKNKSGTTSSKFRTWKYERQMSFLLQYMIRTASGNSQDTSNQDFYHPGQLEEQQDIKLEEKDYLYYAEVENNAIGDAEDVMENSYVGVENDNTFEMLEPEVNIMKKQKKKIKRTTVEDIVTKTIKKHEERVDRKSRNEHDELYHFYMSMYGATKKMPSSRQITIKRKIFDIVTEEQEQELEQNNDNTIIQVTSISINPLDTDAKEEQSISAEV